MGTSGSGGGTKARAKLHTGIANAKRIRELAKGALPPHLFFGDADLLTLERLANTLAERRSAPIALVGAGVSQSLNYPSWKKLLDNLHTMAFGKIEATNTVMRSFRRHIRRHPDVIWRAQAYRDAIGDDRIYFSYLRRTFGSSEKRSGTLEALVKLPFRHFFTTNYDLALVDAYARVRKIKPDIVEWTDAERSADLISRWNRPDQQPLCVYLHGFYDKPESMILSEQDYQRAYFQTSGNAQRLAAILLLYPVLFIGFSLSDPDLMSMLRQANTLAFEGTRHFALIGLTSKEEIAGREVERARFKRKFGISPVFFRPGRGYRGLEAILRYLDQRPSRKVTPKKLPAKISEDYCWAENRRWPDDPIKGRFGGNPERGAWQLRATVTRNEDDPEWFYVRVEVTARPGSRARLTGRVDFFVHPTFPHYRYYSTARKGRAAWTFYTYGAFTLGAQVHQDKTLLELDLSGLDRAPPDFLFR